MFPFLLAQSNDQLRVFPLYFLMIILIFNDDLLDFSSLQCKFISFRFHDLKRCKFILILLQKELFFLLEIVPKEYFLIILPIDHVLIEDLLFLVFVIRRTIDNVLVFW